MAMTCLPELGLGWGLNWVLGLGLGLLGGLLGIGGGLVAIPVLAWLHGMDQPTAQGTALVMVVPNVLIGCHRYQQHHPIQWRRLLAMLVPAVIAARLSARLATSIGGEDLRHAFAAFLVFLTALLLWQQGRQAPASGVRLAPLSPRLYPLVGVLSGFMSGMFTIGGGLVVVPALVMLFGTAQTAAQGMALAMVVPGSAVALLSYAQSGHVDWDVGLPLALGGILTVATGVSWACKLRPHALRWLFCAVLLGTAASMSR